MKKRQDDWWKKYTKKYLEDCEAEGCRGEEEPRKNAGQEEFEGNDFDVVERLGDVRDDMESAFDRLLGGDMIGRLFGRSRVPKVMRTEEGIFRRPGVEIRETRKDVVAKIEVPGANKENIDVKIVGQDLIIDASTRSEKRGEGSFSSSYSGYRNVVRLPAPVDGKKARARYEEGVLVVVVPKINQDDEPEDVDVE